MWTSEYWCHFATWQRAASYCPCNNCNHQWPSLWDSSTSTILTRPCPKWLSHVWTTQRSDGRKEISVWWRGIPGGAWVAAHMTTRFFFSQRNPCTSYSWRKCVEHHGDYVEKWYTCVPHLFKKLIFKKYLRFSFEKFSSQLLIREIFKWWNFINPKVSQM